MFTRYRVQVQMWAATVHKYYDSTTSWHDCSTVMHVFIICGYDDDDKAMRGDPGCCENVTVYNDISTYRKWFVKNSHK